MKPLRFSPPPACATFALASLTAYAGTAWANSNPVDMSMQALSRSCIVGCSTLANFASDSDSDAAPFATFADMIVSTAVGAGANSFAASAQGNTTLTGLDSFDVHLAIARPELAAGSVGDYTTRASTSFSFITDASGGTLTIDYVATYQRFTTGTVINTGISFSSPPVLVFTGAQSVPALSFASVAGTSSGSWSYTLDPNTGYSALLSASNSVAFSAGAEGLGTDAIDAHYHVTLPPFTTAVPEPGVAWLWLAALPVLARRLRPRR